MIRVRHTSIALFAAAALLAACEHSKPSAADSSDLANDLALASQQAPANPQFNDTALAASSTQSAPTARRESPRPQPVQAPSSAARREAPQRVTRREPTQTTSSPAPAPTAVSQAPAPSPAAGQIGAGTGLSMYTGSNVCTGSARPGDKLVATVDSPVSGVNGASIPAGATVVLEVASIDNGNNGSGGNVTFRVRSISVNGHDYSAQGDVTTVGAMQRTKVANEDPNADKKKVIGGAIAGAVLGQIFGHSTKSTVIGAAAGGAAGAIAAKAGEKYQSCLPAGSALRLTLAAPITM